MRGDADSARRSVVWGALFCAVLAVPAAAGGTAPRQEIVIRDLRVCQPQTALAETRHAGKWQVISYASGDIVGHMLAAPSLIDPPTVTLPLDYQGLVPCHRRNLEPTLGI